VLLFGAKVGNELSSGCQHVEAIYLAYFYQVDIVTHSGLQVYVA
jgi:hypothetical protein